ncbi:helix-turn-helix domain-containing protein [Megasphaera elsdenii]
MSEQFGTKLRKIRIKKRMSQEELADFLGTSKQVISRYETNQRTPKITTAQEYARKLKVPLLYLIDDTVTSIQDIAIDTSRFLCGDPAQRSSSIIVSMSRDEKVILDLYRQMDSNDKIEIRGEMKGILRAEKYRNKQKEDTVG